MQDNKPYNKQDQPHGLWEYYYSDRKLCFKGLFINGKRYGKHDYYYNDGDSYISNYINDERFGLYVYKHANGRANREYYVR